MNTGLQNTVRIGLGFSCTDNRLGVLRPCFEQLVRASLDLAILKVLLYIVQCFLIIKLHFFSNHDFSITISSAIASTTSVKLGVPSVRARSIFGTPGESEGRRLQLRWYRCAPDLPALSQCDCSTCRSSSCSKTPFHFKARWHSALRSELHDRQEGARFANLRLSAMLMPSDRATAKAPLNVSPAPVVSTASTL